MKHIVSFSGGRTSAYLVHIMEQKRINEGWDVEYIFMDTSAEHPKTYEFVKNVRDHYGINLTCLKYQASQEKQNGGTYKVISIDDCKHDLSVWDGMVDKYGLPFVHGAFCSDRMKNQTFNKYIKDTVKGEYTTWLGIRFDEPSRIWGREIDSTLTNRGFDSFDKSEVYAKAFALQGDRSIQSIKEMVSPFDEFDPLVSQMAEHLNKKRQLKLAYMAAITEFEKEDVLRWWSKMPFDLEIPEHLGNCVFCIKKGVNKVALAAKDEPELAAMYSKFIESKPKSKDFGERSQTMYRGKTSFDGVIQMFSDVSKDDLRESIVNGKKYDTGSCSESCEVFVNQMSMF